LNARFPNPDAPPAPHISVCIDCFNYGRFLTRAIESVLGQKGADFELVVSDDRSTDDSHDIALAFARSDLRIRVFRNPTNLGMVGNRNAALRHARGRLIKPLHADDFLAAPDALARMAAAFDAWPALALVACPARSVDESGRTTGTLTHPHAAKPVSGTGIISRCLLESRNLVGSPTGVMFRRELSARGFDEGFFHAADLEMWFHLLEQGPFQWIADPLVAYRWHPAQQTERDKKTDAAARDLAALHQRYLGRPYVDAKPIVKALIRSGHSSLIAKWNRLRARHSRTPSPVGSPGVNVVGFLASEFGVGSAARAFALAAADSGLPCALVNIRNKVHSNLDTSLGIPPGGFSKTNPHHTNLFTFPAGYTRRFRRDTPRRFFDGRRNIGIWFWELEKFPARWHAAFDAHDEIWTPTKFCEDAFRAVSPVPVRRIPYPFRGSDAPPDRRAFGMPDDEFVFLCTFDFLSLVARKNPEAVIEAFRRAFSPTEKAQLYIKTINSAACPAEAARLRAAAESLRVAWHDDHLRADRVGSLFASCDAYVSLHRSEGLGLGMAQAMWAAKPVIATGHGGNMEFMSASNSHLVGFHLVELETNHGDYEAGNHWAEPDTDHAAALMRRVFDNRTESTTLGLQAARDIRTTLDPSRCTTFLRTHLGATSHPKT